MHSLFVRTIASISLLIPGTTFPAAAERPNIILVMTDDQGWGQMGYYGHPDLKTPHLDAMAKNGLRFDRFYAGASNCSPTRATVMTGRTNDRTGVQDHGFPLRRQEKTVAHALGSVGYTTAHFGKWHLNGLRGPGVPILKGDTHSPGAFGFNHWLSVTNFFDRDPILSRMGKFESHRGDSSEIVIAEALKFLRANRTTTNPLFVVIWYGSPHSPMIGSEADRKAFVDLKVNQQNHLAELVAMDRSVGALRAGLRELEIADNTLLWFNSDNGGLKGYGEATVGGLRGFKNQMYEGGLRVPGIIEWPAVIKEPRVTKYPAGTVDIFPTLAEIANVPDQAMLQPQDGTSLRTLFQRELGARKKPLMFRHRGRGVIVDNQYKLLTVDGKYELYDLETDHDESEDLFDRNPEIANRLKASYLAWNKTVDASVAGHDYPGKKVDPNQPARRFWKDDSAYTPHLELFLPSGDSKKPSKP
ncbi:MAG: sulfatase-like hydrolase/transferase [Fuerstiella sp.]|nr:sulfatase-like hydrolase/transferase [Fuerstiella sp.]MCP4858139.1 sulfatase-like hydrolase/transferase [Fuerstiella sp.]